MQPANGQTVDIPLLMPMTGVRAIDDPNTALLQGIRRRAVRACYVQAAVLVLLGCLVYTEVVDGADENLGYSGFLIVTLLLTTSFALWTHLPQLRRGKALLSRYGWRAAPARVLADKPCLVRVSLEGRELTLRLRRINPVGRQVLLRTGTVWLCGPDEQGRALARVAGSVGHAIADVTDAVPVGPPPVLTRPVSRRPGDDPGMIWARRSFHRAMLILLGVLVLLTGVGIGFLTENGSTGPGDAVFSPVLIVAVLLVVFGVGYVTGARQLARFRQAPYWLPVQVSLDSWTGQPNTSVRTGAGRIILPNGWRGYVDFPRLNFELAANMRATGVLWLAGEPVPGKPVPVGLPGFPLRGIAKIRG